MNPSHYATFDLQSRLRVQIVIYEDVSVCNMSPNFYVLSQPPCFHFTHSVDYETWSICTRTWPCKSKRCVKLCLFYSEHALQSVVLVKQCTQTWFHMSIIACREGFVSLKVVWFYLVSGTSVGNYMTNRVSCVKSYACTCLSNSKSVHT